MRVNGSTPSHSAPRSRPPVPLTPNRHCRGTSSSSHVSVHSIPFPVSHPPDYRSQSPEPVLDLIDGDMEGADDEAGSRRSRILRPLRSLFLPETVTAKPASSSATSASVKPPSIATAATATAQAGTTTSPAPNPLRALANPELVVPAGCMEGCTIMPAPLSIPTNF